MQPSSRPPTSAGRGRGPARWTVWEIALIALSALMIAFPLYAEVSRLVLAPAAPAQEANPQTPPDQGATAAAAPTPEGEGTAQPVAPTDRKSVV